MYGGVKMFNIYEKDILMNDNILYLFNKSIYEYDMKNGGYNLSKAYNLLPEETLDKLGKYKKDRRTVEIGKLQRSNSEFKNNLQQAFKDARKLFFEANELDINDVISIKKDAIFTTKYCKYQNFLDFIEFRPKNTYSSYIRLNKKVELYYSPIQLDIKGLGDESIEYHRDYMIKFINTFFSKMETDNEVNTLRFLRSFVDKYKNKELDIEYYRRFDRDSYFDIVGDTLQYKDYWQENIDDIDISFNYFEILMKLVKIPL